MLPADTPRAPPISLSAEKPLSRSRSVRELAAYWRVSPRKVRALIRRGLLTAIDLGCGRQQLRVTPEAVRECEQRLAVKPPAPRRKRQAEIDPEIARLLEA